MTDDHDDGDGGGAESAAVHASDGDSAFRRASDDGVVDSGNGAAAVRRTADDQPDPAASPQEGATLELDLPFGPLADDVSVEDTGGVYACKKFTPTFSIEYHDQDVENVSDETEFQLKVNPVGDEGVYRMAISEDWARTIIQNTGGWEYVE